MQANRNTIIFDFKMKFIIIAIPIDGLKTELQEQLHYKYLKNFLILLFKIIIIFVFNINKKLKIKFIINF